MKRLLCLLLAAMILLCGVSALAETSVMDYDYTFIPGTILEGEDMDLARELMDAIVIRFTRQVSDEGQIVRLLVISEGEEAFSVSASESGEEGFKIVCSMLGDQILVCRRDQLTSFFQTIVQMLEDLKLIKGESREKFNSVAERAAQALETYLSMDPDTDLETGINLKPYMDIIGEKASGYEERMIPEEERDETGAVKVTTYLLNEEERKQLVEYALSKVTSFPVIGTQLRNGRLRIGEQVITEEFIRLVLAETPGEMSLDLYTDEENKLVRMILQTPDLTNLVTDERFAQVQGVEMTILRNEGENHHLSSETTLRLSGLDGTLMTIRMERTPGETLKPLSGKQVHEVGEMNSKELWKLVRTMKLTIFRNAMNLLLALPKCVFDLAVDKILK